MSDRVLTRGAWLLPVALAAVVWFPITYNYFHFDDFLDLYQLRNDDAARYYLRMYGGHVLIARHAITALLDAAFGPNPRPFFVVVLLTHLLNTGLLYALVVRLTGRWSLAVIAAALWSTSPILEGALGWYAVYGQVAATACVLAVVVGLARPEADRAGRWAAPIGWALLTLLGGLLFGVGIAAALVMPAVAWLLLPPGRTRRRAIGVLVAVAAMLLATYAVLRMLELPLYGRKRLETTFMLAGLTPWVAGAHLRLFGALFGFSLAVLPLRTMVDLSGFPSGAHLAAIAAGGALLVVGGWAGSPAARRRLAACLLLVAAVYGAIAIARSLFIDWLGLWFLARTLRFHYAGGALLTVALATAAGACLARWEPGARLRRTAFVLALAAVCGIALGRPPRINHFAADRAATIRAMREIRAAIAAAPPGATVEIPNRQFGAVGVMNVRQRDTFPGTAAIFAIFYRWNVVAGHRIVFTTDDPLVLEGARRGRRSAALLRELPTPPAADKEPPP